MRDASNGMHHVLNGAPMQEFGATPYKDGATLHGDEVSSVGSKRLPFASKESNNVIIRVKKFFF